MIVGIHQPNYLPYFGFFNKMKNSDVFIIYDDAQFNKGDYQHRNRIRIFNGWKWLTVPVEKKHIPINQIKIKNGAKINGINWQKAHLKEIHDNYRKAPYYTEYWKKLYAIYEQQYDLLIDLNMRLIDFLMKSFDIDTEIVYSSELGLKSKSTEKLVELVNAVGGDVYMSGPSGKNYLDIESFNNEDIQVIFQDFEHPVYRQQFGGFVANMSALDTLFNIGAKVGEDVQKKA